MPLILASPYLKKIIQDLFAPYEYDPYFNDVTMLLNMEGNVDTSVTDLKGTTINGTPRISSEQKKFGSSSAKIVRGTTTGLYVANSAALGFGAGNYTIEGWFYFKNSTARQILFDFRRSNGDFYSGVFYMENGLFKFQVGSSQNAFGDWFPVPAAYLNAWNFVTAVRIGERVYMAVNGQPVSSYGIGSLDIGTTGNLGIGGDIFANATNGFDGYVDEVRVTKRARYPATAFTPPTTAFDRTGKRYSGWQVAWFSKSNNDDSSVNGSQNTHFKWDIPQVEIDKATTVAIAYFDSTVNGEITVTDMHSFPIPAEWKTKHPFNYPQLDKTVPVTRVADNTLLGDKVVRCGWNSFNNYVNDPWAGLTSSWGRCGIIGTQAPYFSGFATATQDHAALSHQDYRGVNVSSPQYSSPTRRFIILVK